MPGIDLGAINNNKKLLPPSGACILGLSERRSIWHSNELPHIVDNIDVILFSLLDALLCFSEDNLAVPDVSE